jgi:predicted nucleotidyltransferase
MKKKLLDISNKIDRFNLEILNGIKEEADKLLIDFFIVGATVRDYILNLVYNIPIYRATNDIDFAISVRNWEEYNLLANAIEEIGFVKNKKILHRYNYKGMIIDLIPFGAITQVKKTIVWPDKDAKEMNIIGFEEAYNNAEEILIQIDPRIVIKAASVESLVMLKIFAWHERDLDIRVKDAKDIYLIISTYLDAGNRDRCYEEHSDIFEDVTDYEIGGARLLGRDIYKISSPNVLKYLLEILSDGGLDVLAVEMAKYESIHLDNEEEKIEKCKELLLNLCKGLEDKI